MQLREHISEMEKSVVNMLTTSINSYTQSMQLPDSIRFEAPLTKNLTAHLTQNLFEVLP